jgi:23S rRNA G2069 N7-methylase RlmK/C1962 C5-methylase RlmI
MDKKVIDVCCGPRGFWFDKNDERALYLDKRRETHVDVYKCGIKTNIINPDIIGDFTNIDQPDESYWHVVFDPPHISSSSDSGQIVKKYGRLENDWREMIRQGFKECFRILKPNGTLIFKWSEVQYPIKDILELTEHKPLYGHKSGKRMNTHWVAFIK